MAISKGRRKRAVTVIEFSKGSRVDLGKGSFSNLLLTSSTLADNKSTMGYSVFKPGVNTTLKVHHGAEELAYVISGSGNITIEAGTVGFKEGDSIFIPSGVAHGIENNGEKDVVMIFFFSTPKYPRTTDAVGC